MAVAEIKLNRYFRSLEIMMQVLESKQLSELIGLIRLTHWMPQYFQNMICVSEIQNDLLYDKGL